MQPHTQRLKRIQRSAAGLLVVDLQERLLPAIHEHERVVRNAVCLIRSATVLGLPLFATEQYRNGLGATVPEVAQASADFAPVEKLTFSACGESSVPQALAARGVNEVVLCGIETHVCIAQTCLDLLDRGSRVFVVADAVSSRTVENHHHGLERLRAAGAVVVSTEMILFELLERAGTPEFKQILQWVK